MIGRGFVLSLLIGSTAWAQQSTISITAPANTAPTAPVQTSSISTTEVAPAKAAWQASLGSENYTYELDQRSYGSRAPIMSYNWVGAIYNINPKWAVELRQNFQYASATENLSGRDKIVNQDSVALAETMLRVATKPGKSIWGSKPATYELRYYAPTDRAAQINKELGRLRADAYAEWMMSPKWSVALWLSPRVLLNSTSNPNKAVGADAEYYQMKAAPYFSYYLNDDVVFYYADTLNMKFSQAQRGNWSPDLANIAAHEAGMYLTYGAFTFNPALISETNLSNSDTALFTANSRFFSYENISYNFNVYATF